MLAAYKLNIVGKAVRYHNGNNSGKMFLTPNILLFATDDNFFLKLQIKMKYSQTL